ncbi:hypothetical protein MKW98_015773 [Papaver atlanticum]|uniref:S-adenosylmethionine-dependent methyltransferase n=1 Tax=Papaver atlanticum TaxID=357466 RepID=A0AAD4XMA6_9MAGN|nr:hypothetical protein MKW98_015773 [Papaver atlanticum]
MIEEGIAGKLDIQDLPNSSTTFRIADFGCSVGPNTFIAMKNIIQALDLKYNSHYHQTAGGLVSTDNVNTTPDYHVSFSDNTFNDFNTLFASLPERKYLVSGVPGSFYNRLFPRDSLHFVHTSSALHFLSGVLKEVVDINSPAWNNGRIHYTNAPDEVAAAYTAQHSVDMKAFLCARAQEIVCGGLMVMLIPAIPDGTSPSLRHPGILSDLLGSCLMDMAKMGLVDEDKVDLFNLPVYSTSPKEVKDAVENNGCFSIERIELNNSSNIAQIYGDHERAVGEGIIKEYFGNDITEKLFELYPKKLADSLSILASGKSTLLFVLLKRNKATAAE